MLVGFLELILPQEGETGQVSAENELSLVFTAAPTFGIQSLCFSVVKPAFTVLTGIDFVEKLTVAKLSPLCELQFKST